jgi:hypothetical protein
LGLLGSLLQYSLISTLSCGSILLPLCNNNPHLYSGHILHIISSPHFFVGMRGVKKFFKGRNKKENVAGAGAASDAAAASSSSMTIGADGAGAAATADLSVSSSRRVSSATFTASATPRSAAALTESSDELDPQRTSSSSLTPARAARKSMEASGTNQPITSATTIGGAGSSVTGTGKGDSINAGRRTLKQVNEESEREILLRDDEEDSPNLVMSYNAVPVLEQVKLPRGGVSVDTKAVGRVQVRS